MGQFTRLKKGYNYLSTLRNWYGEFRPDTYHYQPSGMTAAEHRVWLEARRRENLEKIRREIK